MSIAFLRHRVRTFVDTGHELSAHLWIIQDGCLMVKVIKVTRLKRDGCRLCQDGDIILPKNEGLLGGAWKDNIIEA